MTKTNELATLYVQSGTHNEQGSKPRQLQGSAGKVDGHSGPDHDRRQWLHGLHPQPGRDRDDRGWRLLREQRGRRAEGVHAHELGRHKPLGRIAALTALVSVAVLAGCAAPTVYRDPVSGQVAQCNASTPGMFPIVAKGEIDSCSAAYERMGWKKQ